jgi:PPOX class probable F420-dependent enzyme
VSSGTVAALDELGSDVLAIVNDTRRAVLSSVGADGSPHSVPVVFAVIDKEIVTPIDEKPKSGKKLGRIRNIENNPQVSLLFDHWDEDWTRIGWVMVRGRARVDVRTDAIAPLKERYPQYDTTELALKGDAIVVEPERIMWWTWR